MKAIGYLLITVGFLVGSLAATSDKEVVYWNYFVVGLLVGVAGVVLVRIALRRHTHGGGRLTANIQTIEASLSRIVENLTKLDAEKQSIDTYDVRHRIDDQFADDLEMFVDARESIAHRYGLAAYGEVMTTFAAGERYLNRVWSASADGYIDEVNDYLERAKDQFAETLAALRRLQAGPQPA
jgi:uncharacterized membrane-anchored protein YhcB (DUF1043 family)